MNVNRRSLSLVQGRVDRLWTPRIATHHLIIGESGAGKTGLIRDGILPLCVYDRVLFIDVKNDTDQMLSNWGVPIGPNDVLKAFAGGARWYRLIVDPINDRERAQSAVRLALQLALDIGDTIVVTDETRTITEQSQLGLSSDYERLLMRGRSMGVSCISAVAATDNTYPAVKTQWSFAWVGSVNGSDVITETLKILGLPHTVRLNNDPNHYRAMLRDLERYEWLYVDKERGNHPGNRCLARVQSYSPSNRESA
jgi:hypothetical protein